VSGSPVIGGDGVACASTDGVNVIPMILPPVLLPLQHQPDAVDKAGTADDV
jgi:hypothetical protein